MNADAPANREPAVSGDNLKNVLFLIFGSYFIGIVTRKSWDSINHFPVVADSSLIDIDMICYGVIFVLSTLWCQIVVHSFYDSKLISKYAIKFEKAWNQGHRMIRLLI